MEKSPSSAFTYKPTASLPSPTSDNVVFDLPKKTANEKFEYTFIIELVSKTAFRKAPMQAETSFA